MGSVRGILSLFKNYIIPQSHNYLLRCFKYAGAGDQVAWAARNIYQAFGFQILDKHYIIMYLQALARYSKFINIR